MQLSTKKKITPSHKYSYIAVDIGGTFIKSGIVDQNGKVLYFKNIPTQARLGKKQLLLDLIELIKNLIFEAKKITANIGNVIGVGIGVPGIVDKTLGLVRCSYALKMHNFELASFIEKEVSIPVKICNDADAAMLGEKECGLCKGVDNALLITIGTGIGGSAIVNGELLTGEKGCGGEFGHEVIVFDGKKCSCGRKGCFQSYASAKAFEEQITECLKLHPDSKMLKENELKDINAKIAFDYYSKDYYARKLVDNYIRYLATGIVNFVNIFRPQIVVLAGGITAQGDKLVKPLQKLVDKQLFDKSRLSKIKIEVSQLVNPALIGAVSLFKNI